MGDQEETEAKQVEERSPLGQEAGRKTRLEWAKIAASTVDAVARLADLAARMVR